MGGNDASQYISLFYTADALKNTWRPKMRSFATGLNYKAIEGPTWIPYSQAKCKELGRPRGTRMRGDMDAAETVSSLRRCRICNEIRHDRRTCKPIISQ
jgi:hypothetical protein